MTDQDPSFGLGPDPDPRPTSVTFQTETGSIYELEARRVRRLGHATTFRLAQNLPNVAEWSPIEGHSDVQIGSSVALYWKTVTDGRGTRVEATITSPVKEILCETLAV
jgi:hypothetical protein